MTTRMRTIKECINLIKSDDPQSCFTERTLRTKIISGEFPSVRIGTKYLVNYDLLLSILNNPNQPEHLPIPKNSIRPIPEEIFIQETC